MRLIDADEIIKETWGVVIKDMFHMHETVEVVSTIDIEKAPTVKAIPIEWIENKLKCCDNINAEIFVKSLIREWRKENGRS